MAQWSRMSDAVGVEWDNQCGLPTEKAYHRFCRTWQLTERIPSVETQRRHLAETEANVRGFFSGKTETYGDGANGVPPVTIT